MMSPKGSPKKTKVLVLHRSPVTRLGLATLLRTRLGLTVCGESGDVPQARELFVRWQPDLVVLDLALEHGDGIELIKDFRKLNAAARALVFTDRDDALSVERAFRAGAGGYLAALDEAAELERAVEAIGRGEIYASASVSRQLVNNLLFTRGDGKESRTERLSDRELQVLRLIGGGFGPTRLAAELHVSVKTVEAHRNRIKNKLGLSSGAELNEQAPHWLREAHRARIARNAEVDARLGTMNGRVLPEQ